VRCAQGGAHLAEIVLEHRWAEEQGERAAEFVVHALVITLYERLGKASRGRGVGAVVLCGGCGGQGDGGGEEQVAHGRNFRAPQSYGHQRLARLPVK